MFLKLCSRNHFCAQQYLLNSTHYQPQKFPQKRLRVPLFTVLNELCVRREDNNSCLAIIPDIKAQTDYENSVRCHIE